MTPRIQNLLSIGALIVALVITAFPAKSETPNLEDRIDNHSHDFDYAPQ